MKSRPLKRGKGTDLECNRRRQSESCINVELNSFRGRRTVAYSVMKGPGNPRVIDVQGPEGLPERLTRRPDVGESERAWRRVGGRQIASSEEVFIGGFGDMDISVPTIKAALVPMNRRPRRNAAPQSLNERKGRVVHDRINAPWIRAANKLAPQIRSNNQGTNPSQPFLNIAVLETEQDIVVTDDIVVAERQKGRRPTRPRNNLKCGVEYQRPRLPSSEERAAQVQRR
ncbi:hypothetical protein BDZ89DRAFT_1052002 [Hymenopellis radicata]|nr:hypothetical protein BDZ89DRAFT_1052002 [Hymenopellis radicata]